MRKSDAFFDLSNLLSPQQDNSTAKGANLHTLLASEFGEAIDLLEKTGSVRRSATDFIKQTMQDLAMKRKKENELRDNKKPSDHFQYEHIFQQIAKQRAKKYGMIAK